jgi:hypothetical protein
MNLLPNPNKKEKLVGVYDLILIPSLTQRSGILLSLLISERLIILPLYQVIPVFFGKGIIFKSY